MVFIVTHFIRKAAEISQKTVVFHLGSLVKDGNPQTFLWLRSMKQQTTVSPVILAEPIAGLSSLTWQGGFTLLAEVKRM